MNPLLKMMFHKVLAEHGIDELSNENFYEEIEKEYNRTVEEYHSKQDSE